MCVHVCAHTQGCVCVYSECVYVCVCVHVWFIGELDLDFSHMPDKESTVALNPQPK